MTRTNLPLLLLAEPKACHRPQSGVHFLDAAFLTTALVTVLGGSLFLLDLGAARSSGQVTTLSQLMSEASIWLPAIMSGAAKYATLFLASVVSSALLVFLVTALRSLDRKVGRLCTRQAFGFTPISKVHDVRRPLAVRTRDTRVHSRESQGFLLCPVFR